MQGNNRMIAGVFTWKSDHALRGISPGIVVSVSAVNISNQAIYFRTQSGKI